MAHIEQRNFCLKVKEKFPEYFKNKKVLDIGSLDINGNNKELFENCNYLGIDVGEGKNVDLISIGHLFDGPDEYYDTIISTEVFEHDMFYEKTIQNIIRMLKPGGLFLFTCAAPGRPEHGTRRCGEFCAPLLLQVSEDWADYYKNLTEEDIRKIPNFNIAFPDCYFELNEVNVEIPSDLYFYGIKGGEKYLSSFTPKNEKYNDHIFIIDCWPNTESKENDLINLIKLLKKYGIDILLTGHYPIKTEIQKLVDYYIFDKNNPLLTNDEYESYGINNSRWTKMMNYTVTNTVLFHHDYAIWETMRNSFNFAKYLDKKYIHFLEYDNIPNELQYRQSFLEKIDIYDAIIYEYNFNSSITEHLNPFCATFIFSIKTDIATKVIDKFKSKRSYFYDKPKGFQLERVFLDCLRQVTNNIHVSEYIANDNELNIQAVWNRDGLLRNGERFQFYLACDKDDNLYIHLISGFSDKKADKDYLIELNYLNYKKFIRLNIGHYYTEQIGKYKKGGRVKGYYLGSEVYNEFLGMEVEEFRSLNNIKWDDEKEIEIRTPPKYNLNFVDGPTIEILTDKKSTYLVQFINKKDNKIYYETTINNNSWVKNNLKYFVDWKILVKDQYETKIFDLSLKDKRVFICFESKSLGDNIAWIPYVEKFRQVHNCNVICSTFHNNLFKNQYKDIEFVEPGTTVYNIFALYRIGLFMDNNKKIDFSRHPNNPRTEPLTKIASDILGLEYEEIQPKLPVYSTKKLKRVSIAIHSTAQCKYWNNPNGWQDVVDYLNSKGYEVLLLSKEVDGYMGNKTPKGVKKLKPGKIEDLMKVLQESEFFIGISSGLSWLSWGSGIPTVLISGFTDDYLEPKNGIIRVINKNVCNGCWHTHEFDPGDWNWCPIHKDTEKQFECSKTITSEQVIKQIEDNLLVKLN